MKVAMVSPLEMKVPPMGYGGIELLISLLTEELVQKGHDVTLFASSDSVTSGKLQSICPTFLRGTSRHKGILNMLNVVSCLERAKDFDIIHNHTVFEGMATAGLVKTPMLTTFHGHLEGDWLDLFAHYRGWYNTISVAARNLLPERDGFAGVIYNAVDVQSYPFNAGKREPFLLFLSRMSQEKGPHLAIEVAKKLESRLILAGNIDSVDESYFKTMVLPHIDGDQIQYIGEADQERKRDLLLQAHCLLAPICWPEPFGLFMVEAMACGTPVVAFNRGAASEVVRDGETGYVIDTLDEMVDAVQRVDGIDSHRCREHVYRNFDVPRLVDDYLAAYHLVLADASTVTSAKEAASAEILIFQTLGINDQRLESPMPAKN